MKQDFISTIGQFFGLLNLGGNEARDLTNPCVSNLNFPTLDSVKQIVWYAASVACSPESLKAWSCKSCKLATNSEIKGTIPFKDEKTMVSGYYTVDHSKKNIILAFRGTNNIQNLLQDLDSKQVPFPEFSNPSVKVHSGFLNSLDSVQNSFINVLQDDLKKSDYSLVITGVSLGAAIANLAAVRVRNITKIPYNKLSVYAFGQPRTGNRAFATEFNLLPLTYVRAVNYNDPVPHGPSSTYENYTHVANQLHATPKEDKQCNSNVYEDPTCANSIEPSIMNIPSHFQIWDTRFFPSEAC